ncbi:hypothetical protein [Streptomyces aureus]|uniref:hypothetical protein n=1 Tax=Streptomyces aureus TaxID=193461 RepID=UPI0006E2A4CF|nr:hypothetical protein [Streptomyces aureus]
MVGQYGSIAPSQEAASAIAAQARLRVPQTGPLEGRVGHAQVADGHLGTDELRFGGPQRGELLGEVNRA